MNNIFLKGKTIYFRPLEQKDLTMEYVSWMNDSEVCQFNSHSTFPYTIEKSEAYYQHLQQSANTIIALAIIDISSNKHIGNISLQGINWINNSAEFAIILGDKSFWGRGVASEAFFLMFDYGFTRLNLHRIYYGTSSKNLAVHKLAVKMKMTQEGIRKEAMFKNGEYVDIIEYGVLKNDFLK